MDFEKNCVAIVTMLDHRPNLACATGSVEPQKQVNAYHSRWEHW